MLANCQFAFSLAFGATIRTFYLHDRYFLHSNALASLRPIALGTGQKSDVPRLPQACALFRHRRGRETKTSSNASREAPERARKDTPKEANCISRAASLLCVFPVKFLRLSRDASHVRGGDYGCSPPARAGNLFRLNDLDLRPSRLDSGILYQKIRSAAENAARTDSPPQTYPGSLCRTLLVSILIYGGIRKI